MGVCSIAHTSAFVRVFWNALPDGARFRAYLYVTGRNLKILS